jgi:YD repeat-containing protein
VAYSFLYNPARQVTSFTSSSSLYNYRETQSSSASRTFNGLNQDAGIAAIAGGYDAAGNLANDGTRVMTYDAFNRLITVTGSGVNLQLDYDPEGRLFRSTSGGVTTYYSYDGVNPVGE